jgi:hypothetical protein
MGAKRPFSFLSEYGFVVSHPFVHRFMPEEP